MTISAGETRNQRKEAGQKEEMNKHDCQWDGFPNWRFVQQSVINPCQKNDIELESGKKSNIIPEMKGILTFPEITVSDWSKKTRLPSFRVQAQKNEEHLAASYALRREHWATSGRHSAGALRTRPLDIGFQEGLRKTHQYSKN